MVSICVICQDDERTDVDGYVCRRCLRRVDSDLRAIVDRTRAAALAIRPGTAPASGSAPAGKPGSRPPIDLGALDDSQGFEALAVLESWERLIREDFGLVRYGEATEAEPASVDRSVAFLRAWLPKLCRAWPAVDELAREVRQTADALHRYAATDVRLSEVRRMAAARIDSGGPDSWLSVADAATLTGYTARHIRRLAGAGSIERRNGLVSLASIRALATSGLPATLRS